MTVLSLKAQETLREASSQKLKELSQEAVASEAPSWVRGGEEEARSTKKEDPATHHTRRSRQCQFFDHAGFLKIDGFVDGATCQAMKDQMADMANSEWHPERDGIDSFGTGTTQNLKRGDYFLESSDKVHYFAEPGALENDGTQLKAEYHYGNKVRALNKAGHALHTRPGSVFEEYCFSDKIRNLLLDLGWKDPVVPQSMYIFKQARTGGAVHSHQDSTFLFTSPKQTCVGLWLALDEATLDNGCLWVRPGSHLQESTRRHYQRNVEHFGASSVAKRSNEACGDASKTKFVMKELPPAIVGGEPEIPWDGKLPGDGSWEELLKAGFIPVECKAGDLLAFCGELDHLSLPNNSDNARHTFQLHCVEGPSEGIIWSEYNWLQYADGEPFVKLNRS